MDEIISINQEIIQDKIYTIRDTQVMIDEDLAILYDVESKRLNEQVKRNIDRFPEKFRFQLTQEEYENLRSQFATLSLEKVWRKVFDAYLFVSDIVKSATKSIKLIDNFDKDIYHIGASLKDLGKKWFGVSKMDIDSFKLLERLI